MLFTFFQINIISQCLESSDLVPNLHITFPLSQGSSNNDHYNVSLLLEEPWPVLVLFWVWNSLMGFFFSFLLLLLSGKCYF